MLKIGLIHILSMCELILFALSLFLICDTFREILLYLNTCNGYTRLANNDWKPEDGQGEEVFSEGNKVMSVRNRLLLHDGSIPHCSTTCTDQRMRILIAFNYF